ncbi:MAG: hypothetical protein IPI67_04070 [Myxococcales bacterium]|nr:hypothetical protein [Myxococcales bacterium]
MIPTSARGLGLIAALLLASCGGSGSSGSAGGGTSGSGASAGQGGGGLGGNAGGGSGGIGGGAGLGGAAGSAGTGGSGALGGGGSGAADGWSATPEWTSLPIPLQFGPALAAHPVNASQFSVLANTYSVSGTDIVTATTTDLGTSFPSLGKLSKLPQTAQAEPKGIAYNPKNPQELAAVLWIQGDPNDPESGGHLYRSTDGGKTFADAPLGKSLPVNALAFSALRFTSDGLMAIRTDASVVYSADGTATTDSVATPGCSASPGVSSFDVSPSDGKQVVVPCGKALQFCNKAGCTKSPVAYDIVDVRYGTDAQHVAAIGRSTDGTFVALLSEDGGKNFSASPPFKDNVSPSWRVGWDPRAGKHTAYALLISHLFRSSDGGKSWQDITPPQGLNYIYDFVVAADGRLIGRGVFHYLLLAPT